MSRKAAFTSVSVRVAVALFFLIAFAETFPPAASGKVRRSSRVKGVLEGGFAFAGVLLKGPGSGQLIPEGPVSSDESWLIFPLRGRTEIYRQIKTYLLKEKIPVTGNTAST